MFRECSRQKRLILHRCVPSRAKGNHDYRVVAVPEPFRRLQLFKHIRSAGPTITRYPTFPEEWSEDQKADFIQYALDQIHHYFLDMRRVAAEFNEIIFRPLHALDQDIRGEITFSFLEELEEEWQRDWSTFHEDELSPYKGCRENTVDSRVKVLRGT